MDISLVVTRKTYFTSLMFTRDINPILGDNVYPCAVKCTADECYELKVPTNPGLSKEAIRAG